jgi:hypothetical protein
VIKPTTRGKAAPKTSDLKFGYQKHPLKVAVDGLTLSIGKNKEGLVYKRKLLDDKVEKILLSTGGKIIINPVEPMNIPKQITHYFQAQFEKPVMVGPKQSTSIFLTFPIEIGVFISENRKSKLIDVFSFVKNKYTLYGDPKIGMICRHWKSRVYPKLPKLNPLHEGALKLTLKNMTNRWMELTNAVFYGYGMEIYYSSALVSMVTTMKIKNKQLAETDVIDSPLKKGMTRSLETLPLKFIPLPEKKVFMEGGL